MEREAVEILLIEDNVHDAAMTIRELKRHNMANFLVHLKDGEEALQFIFGTGPYEGKPLQANTPKLILLDIQMPKVNGIELLRELKNNPDTRTIPVVMLTSSKESPDIARCYELGVNSYIVKPVNFDAFTEAIRQLGFYWLLLNQSSK